jgi:hypothetical protein
MIAIVNIGPFDDIDPVGWRNYEVRINDTPFCTFRHKRSDGLGRCLLEAGRAVEKERWRRAAELLMPEGSRMLPNQQAMESNEKKVNPTKPFSKIGGMENGKGEKNDAHS